MFDEYDKLLQDLETELNRLYRSVLAESVSPTKGNNKSSNLKRLVRISQLLDFVSYLAEDISTAPPVHIPKGNQFPHLIAQQYLLRFIEIHTLKDYPELRDPKTRECLDKLDPNVVKGYLYQFYQQFVQAFNKPCIDTKILDATPIRELHKYIYNTLGDDCYKYLLERFSEPYGFYRKPETAVHIISLVLGFYRKDPLTIEYVLMTYGSFAFSRMWQQFFKYCNPDLLVGAIQQMRENSLFARYKTNYLEIVGYIAATKFHTLLSKDSLTAHNVSLLFSTIKIRIKDVLKNLAQKYYELYRKGYHTNTEIVKERVDLTTSSEVGQFVELAVQQLRMQDEPAADIVQIMAKKLGISVMTALTYIEYMLKVLHSKYDDEQVKKLLYAILTAAGLPSKQEICNYEYLRKLDRVLKSRSPRAEELKQALDTLIVLTLEELENAGYSSLTKANVMGYTSTRAKYRRLTLYYIYITAIKQAVCAV